MARTFTAITGSGSSGEYEDDDPLGYQGVEKIRQALDLLAGFGYTAALGGDERPVLSASYVPVNGAMPILWNGDNDGGMTLECEVWYYTSNASTSVRVRLRNTTDSSNAAEGTLSTATTVTKETLTLTLASGSKEYQLQVTGSDAVNGVYAWGRMRIRKEPV